MTTLGSPTAADRVARPVLCYVLLAFGISWLMWAPVLFGEAGAAGMLLLQVGAFGPAVSAGLVVRWSGGSVRGWLRPLLRWRTPVCYWVYALGLPVALALSVNAVLAALGEQVHLNRLGAAATSWLALLVLGTPLAALQEELGWRGFALDRLQARRSPLAATVLLGVMWGMWHLPIYPGAYRISILVPALLVVPFTWLWNRTGSLLLCAVLHAGVGSLQYLIVADLSPVVVATLLGVLLMVAVALVVATRGRLGFDHRPEPLAERVSDVGRAGVH